MGFLITIIIFLRSMFIRNKRAMEAKKKRQMLDLV